MCAWVGLPFMGLLLLLPSTSMWCVLSVVLILPHADGDPLAVLPRLKRALKVGRTLCITHI